MSKGTDALKEAFRDYEVSGNPATGANEPDKVEIRDGLDKLAVDIAAASVDDPDAIEGLMQPFVDAAEDAKDEAELAAQQAEDAAASIEGTFDTSFDHPDYSTIILDSEGRMIFADGDLGGSGGSPVELEVHQARGSRTSLNDRLSVHLTQYGASKDVQYSGLAFRNVPQLLSRLKATVSGTVLNIALVGDSWTDNNYYAPLLCSELSAIYGNAGDGFCPVARGSALGGATLSLTPGGGGWVTTNTATGGGPTPGAALIAATTSTVGDYIRYGGGTAQTSALLHSVGNGATIEVSLDDGGTWGAPIALTGSGLRVDQIASVSFTYLRVRLASGTWTVSGVEGRRAGPGIRWHNLGAGSGTMVRALSCPEADYVTSLTAMQPDLIVMGWGVNEALGGGTPVNAFINNQNLLLGRFNSSAPFSDKLVWSPPEILGGAPIMHEYDAATRDNAPSKFTHISLQSLFGASIADYGNIGRQYLGSGGGGGGDNNHPTLWGSHVIKSALKTSIEGGSL